MREIKFRAWDIYKKRTFEVKGMKQTPIGTWEVWDGELAILPCNIQLMQYTGKRDKNGKEIYEEDIIRDCNGLDATWVVKWCEEEACFLGLDWCGKPNEVIGNIYSNPELIKEG